MPETVRSFIDDLGGNTAVASATKYQTGAVALWVHRNRLPRSAWPDIMIAFPAVKLPRLMAMEAVSDTTTQDKAA